VINLPERIARRLLLVATVIGGSLAAQSVPEQAASSSAGEFSFTRLFYQGNGGGCSGRGRSSSRWNTDYDSAEYYFRRGVERLSRIDYGGDMVLALDSEEIMNYPWLYAVEVGSWYLDEQEAAMLREYLLRGGFLLVDDFWGTCQWALFEDSMKRVFPDRPIEDLDESHPLMHTVYDLKMDVQIPGIRYFRTGVTYQDDGFDPHWRGIFDDQRRLMVAINFNMDMGDAWEHADDPRYPQEMTTLALHFAVNYVIYAITH
jgi:hypothetical protein